MGPTRLSRRTFLSAVGTVAAAGNVVAAFPPLRGVASAATNGTLPAPLRDLDKPGFTIASDPAAVLQNNTHRVSFHVATWDGGQTHLRRIEVKVDGQWLPVTAEDHLFDEQWIVLTGAPGTTPYRLEGRGQVYYYDGTLEQNWIALEQLTQPDSDTVELTAASPADWDLQIRWTLEQNGPQVTWNLQVHQNGQYVVGYQSFDVTTIDDVNEVLCGTRQHARFVESRAVDSDNPQLALAGLADNASELMAPMTLVERTIAGAPVTTGVTIPAEMMQFEHLIAAGLTNQPYGMSLRNESNGVQPVAFAPQAGERAELTAGSTASFSLGILATPVTLSEAYRQLARDEYGLTDYRENIYDTSLTDAMYNVLDLTMIDPPGDGTGDYVPSPSGWWKRAKGFANPEHYRTVRQPTSGVMMGAYLITGDADVYERRARPLMEYQLSRAGISWTPDLSITSVQDGTPPHGLCRIPRDASTLVPLYHQTAGQNAGIRALALEDIRRDRTKWLGVDRTPMSTPLAAYALSRSEARLAELHAIALRYARDEVLIPYTTQVADTRMQSVYSKAWTELLLCYEITGDPELLDAARREALRYITQWSLAPIPDQQISVPIPPVKGRVPGGEGNPTMWDYPRDDEPSETVPGWMVATTGMAFEQLSTYRGGSGFSTLPVWAPFLARLAAHTQDDLLRDVARNLVVGRFASYPGYKYWQFRVRQMQPDFPLQGPDSAGMIYYNHIASHLGMTIDYLISDQVARSDWNIDFPAQFESDYRYFRFHTYGHAPGTFYGDDDVWLHMPKGIVTVDNPQINWIAAEGNGALYLGLTNSSNQNQNVTVSFDPALSGVDPTVNHVMTIWRDNGNPVTHTLTGDSFTTVVSASTGVSARGITAIKIDNVDLDVPHHRLPATPDTGTTSFDFDDASPVGKVRGMLLVRPDRTGYDAFIQVDTDELATLRYSLDDGQTWTTDIAAEFPSEWTISVTDLTATFTYQIQVDQLATSQTTVYLPAAVTGSCPAGATACVELRCSEDTTPGDTVTAEARVYNGGSTPLAGASVSLVMPAGFIATPEGNPLTDVPAGEMGVWRFQVEVPDSQPADTVAIHATATWQGGSEDSAPSEVDVLPAVKLIGLTCSPERQVQPGDSSTVTATVVNRSPLPQSGQIALSVFSSLGWSFSPGATASYQVDGRGTAEVQVQLQSPSNAQTDFGYAVYAELDDGTRMQTTLTIANHDTILTINSLPLFVSATGEWILSTLRGYGGSRNSWFSPGPTKELGATATFRPPLPEAGSYEVYVWYPSNFATTSGAQFTVHHADGDNDIIVDQLQNARSWFLLGTFDFAAGSDGYVRLTVTNPDYHRISAVRFHQL